MTNEIVGDKVAWVRGCVGRFISYLRFQLVGIALGGGEVTRDPWRRGRSPSKVVRLGTLALFKTFECGKKRFVGSIGLARQRGRLLRRATARNVERGFVGMRICTYMMMYDLCAFPRDTRLPSTPPTFFCVA